MSPEYFALALDLQLALRHLQAPGGPNGTNITMDQLCYKPVPGHSCIVESPLQWFGANPLLLKYYGGTPTALEAHVKLCTTSSLTYSCLSDIQIPTDANVVLGGYDAKALDYMNATALVLTFLLNNAPQDNSTTTAEFLNLAMTWEAQWLATVESYMHNASWANLSIAYSAERSVQDELSRESGADVRIIAISYILMFLYVSFALGGVRFDMYFFLNSKVMLAFAGIILVILSVLASAGINSFIGVKATLIISGASPPPPYIRDRVV